MNLGDRNHYCFYLYVSNQKNENRNTKLINHDSKIDLDAVNKKEKFSIFHEIYYCVRTNSLEINILNELTGC